MLSDDGATILIAGDKYKIIKGKLVLVVIQ